MAHGSNSAKLRNTLQASVSTDPEYLKKVMAESMAKEEEAAQARKKLKEVKMSEMNKEEKKGGLEGALDAFEDDLDVEGEDALMEDQNKAKLGAEINLLKSMSSEMLDEGERRLKNAKHGDSVDKYMNSD